jgi:enoyl-CoA hydratase/long-chain 3-hydroxyacyl-CoA dehydrogenase
MYTYTYTGMSAVKKHDYGKPKREIKSVAVLGAGLMGAGIAEVSAVTAKYRVFLKDRDAGAVSRGENQLLKSLNGKLKKKKISNYDYCLNTSRLVALHDKSPSWKKHFQGADMVIEAVFEEIGLKHRVLQEMEEVISDDCVYATNTSAIPISRIAEGARIPERVIGMCVYMCVCNVCLCVCIYVYIYVY